MKEGARFRYNGQTSTATEMIRTGSGDCYAMSDYLFGRLSAVHIIADIAV